MSFRLLTSANYIRNLKHVMFNPISRSGALWLPNFTRLPSTFFDNIDKMSFQDISYHISSNILDNDIDKIYQKSSEFGSIVNPSNYYFSAKNTIKFSNCIILTIDKNQTMVKILNCPEYYF